MRSFLRSFSCDLLSCAALFLPPFFSVRFTGLRFSSGIAFTLLAFFGFIFFAPVRLTPEIFCLLRCDCAPFAAGLFMRTGLPVFLTAEALVFLAVVFFAAIFFAAIFFAGIFFATFFGAVLFFAAIFFTVFLGAALFFTAAFFFTAVFFAAFLGAAFFFAAVFFFAERAAFVRVAMILNLGVYEDIENYLPAFLVL